ncbi:alpha/beta fold hydrolase [Plastoroseomonas hellenica]|uniref:alpha/beta fold hydrolase n=1 Tax=Plastoroseomonas hellenica TaxID=2687306 RepID=UPI001BAE2277|nr:alpha/beta fold hydrolase [Plastoroseomonas hellenica]MBR0644864.1 alpha/beta fold hydrolase [Plastoroseomonas hellenica]
MRLNAVDAGTGRPVVLLHGLFGAAQNWGTVQSALASLARVVALDLRNHGAAPHDPVMDYAAMAADVAETMTALGIPSAAVLGHSMGGKVAMALALAAPERVERLVVVDIAPRRYGPSNRTIAAALQALPLEHSLTRKAADSALAATIAEPGMRAFLLQNLRFENPPYWRNGLDEIAAAMPVIEDFPELGATYAGPVGVIRGSRSDYVRDEDWPAIRALFPAATLTAVAAGHWVHAENPAGFLEVAEPLLGLG